MIISMGIDIVKIEEIQDSIEKSKRFLERVFTPQEISYCESKVNKYASYAARFAAKEAIMKALCTGWNNGVQWKQIEVINGDMEEVKSKQLKVNSGKGNNDQFPMPNANNGKPEIKLTGKALKLSKEMGVEIIFLSLSHCKHNAIANVIFEGNYDEEIYF